jgi:hypothetical protein
MTLGVDFPLGERPLSRWLPRDSYGENPGAGLTYKLKSFVPDQGVNTEFRREADFDEGTLALGVDVRVSVDSETLDQSIR